MSTFPTNPALEAAIVAHAEEDTPRLAYADWLDEHGDPDRAEFIRVQCRLADLSPAAPDWIDLTERQHELVARLTHRPLFSGLAAERTSFGIPIPERFYFGLSLVDRYGEPFRRGFPYCISCQTKDDEWTADEVKRVAAELARLVRTTTVRGFYPYSTPIERLSALLSEPVIGELTALSLSPHASADDPNRWAEMSRFYRALGTNPLLRRVRKLELSAFTYHNAVEPLTAAETFDSVVRFRVGWHWAEPRPVARFMEAPWVRRLRHFDAGLDGNAGEVMAAGLGRLPELQTLEVVDPAPTAVSALAAGAFPVLARLDYRGPLGVEHAKALAKAKFPVLVAFEVNKGDTQNNAFIELLKADWFERLRVLRFEESPLGDRVVKALAAHPVAKSLRVLHLSDHAFGPEGLKALARGAFPNLTTLSAWLCFNRRGTPANLAKFPAALQCPNLRHLDLNGWQLGDDGAKKLAKNRSLAGLTRLSLENCRIGDAGAKALIASPHLQNLVELRLGANPIRYGADALTDPAVLPRLGELWLYYRALSKRTEKKLRHRPGLYFVA